MLLGIYGQAFDPIDADPCADFSSFKYPGQSVLTRRSARPSLCELEKALPELTVLASTTVIAGTVDQFFIVIRLA